MASRDKKRSIKKRNKKKFYTTTGSKLACTTRRRSLTKFGKTKTVYPIGLVVKEESSKGNSSSVELQKLIDRDFPFVSEIKPMTDPEPISIPRKSSR